ncbi:MAG TPA: CPBP family intramembrane glutamic endopeptidase [Propionibacteriaceae bacterium]
MGATLDTSRETVSTEVWGVGSIAAPRQVSARFLWLFVVVDYVMVTFIVGVLFAGGLLRPLARASDGLINRTLLANAAALLLVVGLLIMRLGGMRARDLGLVPSKVGVAAMFTVGLWLVVQATELVIEFAVHGRVALDPAWSRYGVLAVFGVLIAQLFGNSLYEDITYRAFLFPQMVLHFRNRWGRQGRRAVVVALVVSQGLFALRHIPIRLLDGSAGVDLLFDLPIVMAIGILLALLYMRTGNLFLVIGVHALIDASTSVVASTVVPPDLLVLLLAVVALLAWPKASGERKLPGPGSVT